MLEVTVLETRVDVKRKSHRNSAARQSGSMKNDALPPHAAKNVKPVSEIQKPLLCISSIDQVASYGK